jgi:hypothetical protein
MPPTPRLFVEMGFVNFSWAGFHPCNSNIWSYRCEPPFFFFYFFCLSLAPKC